MPMEKAEKYGMGALDTSELLAIILRVGQQGMPITQMTSQLMERNDNKLKVLERRTRNELMEMPGIGPVKAFQIEAVLEIMRRYNREKIGDRPKIRSSKDIFSDMKDIAGKEETENIWILILNRANAVIERRQVSRGGTSATVFDLKTILRQVITTPGVEAIIMVHNHPSGNLRPSPQDDSITRSIKEGCQYLGLTFMDHVIVAQDGYYSYFEENRL